MTEFMTDMLKRVNLLAFQRECGFHALSILLCVACQIICERRQTTCVRFHKFLSNQNLSNQKALN